MLSKINLHTPQAQADWAGIDAINQNVWQRIAAKTKGILTPANVISILGALLVIAGVYLLIQTISLVGIVLIIVGRLCDIADGYIADVTGTKSPTGEMLDATLDKVVSFIVLIVVAIYSLVPLVAIILIFLQTIFITALSVYARQQTISLHPTLNGKVAMALLWLILLAFILELYLSNKYSSFENVASVLGYVSMLAFVYYGAMAMHDYYQQTVQKGRDKINA